MKLKTSGWATVEKAVPRNSPDTGRHCAVPRCDQVLVRRPNEKKSAFNKRKTCSQTCRNAFLAKIKTITVVKLGRVCAVPECGRPLVPHLHEQLSNFNARKTCGGRCRGRLSARSRSKSILVTSDRRCEYATCGKILVPRQAEHMRHFAARRTCNKDCGYKLISALNTKRQKTQSCCAICPRKIIRNADEQRGAFLKRQTCSSTCRDALRRKSRRLEVAQLDPKTCDFCTKPFLRRDEEKRSSFLRRKTCRRQCFKALLSLQRSGSGRQVNFYGERLPVVIVANILKVTPPTILRRLGLEQ